jgi:DNA-binding transcriptional LysR family regulator
MLAGMDRLEQMSTFVRVVEAGSLTRAAQQLRLSSAAVSRQLSSLEAELSTSLILRTTRQMNVTEAGRLFYERCVRILREIGDARDAVMQPRGVHGLLTVSAAVTFGLALIAPHVPRLLLRHPGLRIDLRLEDRAIDLLGDAVDIALRANLPPPDSTEVVAQPFTTWQRVLVASPSYLRRQGVPRDPAALANHEALVHLPAGAATGTWQLERDGRRLDVQVKGAFRSNALSALREAAIAGAGIALLPDWLVAGELESGALRALLSDWRVPAAEVFALVRSDVRGTPRVARFLDYFRDIFDTKASSSRRPVRRKRR